MHLNRVFGQFEMAQVFIRDYVQSPDQSKALIPGAAQRFGLMPAMPLPDEALNKISHYFWHYAERNNWQLSMAIYFDPPLANKIDPPDALVG